MGGFIVSKGGIFDLPKEAYRNGSYGEELYDLPQGATISNYALKGYEDLKETLNDIESQLDRIIAKKKLIKS